MTNGDISYSVKEVFGRIETKIDGLAIALDKKADRALVEGLTLRVAAIELDRAQSKGRGTTWRDAGRLATVAGGWLLALALYVAQHYSG